MGHRAGPTLGVVQEIVYGHPSTPTSHLPGGRPDRLIGGRDTSNATLNLAIVLAGPLVVTTVVARRPRG